MKLKLIEKHLQTGSGRTGPAYGNMPALLQGGVIPVYLCPVPYVGERS